MMMSRPMSKKKLYKLCLQLKNKQVPAKRAVVSLENFRDRSLSSFATSNTRLLFKKLKIPDTFQLLAIQWDENQDCQIAKAFCKSLAVINDHA